MFERYRKALKITVALAVAGTTAALLAQSPQKSDIANPSEWQTYGNGAGQLFYSPLDQINDRNVSTLGLSWSVDLPARDGPFGNTLVAGDIAYESVAGGRIYAVDVRAGKLLWQFEPEINFSGAALATFIGARLQRGLALKDDKVFIPLPDCRMVALDRKNGEKLWDRQTCDRTAGFTQTGAPLIAKSLVVVGNSCMDAGGRRGFVTALDQKTGEEKWRFQVVPQYPGEPAGGQENEALEMAAKTWGTGLAQQQVGCGGNYGGMTYDPVLNLIYVSTSGAGPWSPTGRAKDAGDELFAGSIVALNADTGEYVWHYKLTPNDGWNWEAFQSLVTDLTIDGQKRRVLMNAPKHGFLIALDAKTGAFISAGKITDVNWAKGFDPKGRPILTGDANYWEKGSEGAIVSPGPTGGHSTQPMSYSPKTGLVYVPASNIPMRLVAQSDAVVGGVAWDAYREEAGHPRNGALVAIDPITQKIRWEIKQAKTYNGGVLSTGGNLVFQSVGTGALEVRAADTGKLLWSKYLGGVQLGAPSTVMIGGDQYILFPYGNATSAGGGLSVPVLTSCEECRHAPARILAFKLGGKKTLPPNPKLPAVPKPPLPRFSEALAAKGKGLYATYACEICHGLEMINGGGTAPDLHRTDEARHHLFADIVRGGLLNQSGMPRFAELTDDDLQSLQAYIINNAWDAHEARGKKAQRVRRDEAPAPVRVH
nr:PQQ-binding-like beta-propeller repeat protein [Sphingomonas sp. CDS-1]